VHSPRGGKVSRSETYALAEQTMAGAAEPRRRFWRISTAGIFFQGGAAAVDTSTVIAALVHGLTGSTLAVGAAAAIARYSSSATLRRSANGGCHFT